MPTKKFANTINHRTRAWSALVLSFIAVLFAVFQQSELSRIVGSMMVWVLVSLPFALTAIVLAAMTVRRYMALSIVSLVLSGIYIASLVVPFITVVASINQYQHLAVEEKQQAIDEQQIDRDKKRHFLAGERADFGNFAVWDVSIDRPTIEDDSCKKDAYVNAVCLRVTLQIENTSDKPLEIDRETLVLVSKDGAKVMRQETSWVESGSGPLDFNIGYLQNGVYGASDIMYGDDNLYSTTIAPHEQRKGSLIYIIAEESLPMESLRHFTSEIYKQPSKDGLYRDSLVLQYILDINTNHGH